MGARLRARTETPVDDRLALRSRAAPVSSSFAPTGGLDVDGVRSLQRTAGNAAVCALLATQRSPALARARVHVAAGGRRATLQRHQESAALLEGLAEPKVLEFEGAQVEVQKDMVTGLEDVISPHEKAFKETKRALEKVDQEVRASQTRLRELMAEVEGFDDPVLVEAVNTNAEIDERRKNVERAFEEANALHARWGVDVIVLGAIEVTSLPASDDELLQKAELIDLPKERNSLDQASAFDLVEQTGLKKKVVANTLNTMIKAGQIDYLRKSGLVGGDWMVLVEVHYYRSRSQITSQFHKDTLGETLFVNLNYHTEHPIAGPEFLLHPPRRLPPSGKESDNGKPDPLEQHEKQIAAKLPPEFLSDLRAIRESAKEPTEIMAPTIPAYGAVAFVDEAIHHMTPLLGHRAVTSAAFAKYLKDKYPGEYTEGKFPPQKTWEKWLKMSQEPDTPYTRPDFREAGMGEDEIDKLVTEYSDSGFQTVTIPRATATPKEQIPLGLTSDVPLKRRMSLTAFRERPEPVTGDRRFFRTWVRAVRRPNADVEK